MGDSVLIAHIYLKKAAVGPQLSRHNEQITSIGTRVACLGNKDASLAIVEVIFSSFMLI
jgi:hypothetical protein